MAANIFLHNNVAQMGATISAMTRIGFLFALTFFLTSGAIAQSTSSATPAKGTSTAAAGAKQNGADPEFEEAYQRFYTGYRLGPGDLIAIRVQGQPEYSKEQVKVSPVGAIYLELLGDVPIGGMTIEQADNHITKELSEFLKDPKVTISLLDAVSAKVGVLGEVLKPGIIVMARPMNLLDAIVEAGGFANTGSKSNVELIRQGPDGSREPKKFNVQQILRGKSKPEENVQLQPGDIVYVHGNVYKKLSTVSSLAGFAGFAAFLGGR
jgi:polysaccharide biosynthesis/export protein